MKWNALAKMVVHKHSPQRFIEIDMLRGLAITLMVFGHILWDLDYFGLAPMNNSFYSLLQDTVPPLFFLLLGMGLIISKKKIENREINDDKKYFKGLFGRGLKIIGLGLAITIGTLLFMPDRPVLFGVLHCIGFCLILSAPFLKYRNYNLLFAMLFIFTGSLIAQYPVANPTIFHLAIGFHQANIWKYTIDYFPLLPWLGISLLGMVIGDWFYCGDKRSFRLPDLSKYRPAKIFSWVGKHSLGIYLLHQPIIAGVISVFILL